MNGATIAMEGIEQTLPGDKKVTKLTNVTHTVYIDFLLQYHVAISQAPIISSVSVDSCMYKLECFSCAVKHAVVESAGLFSPHYSQCMTIACL